MSLPLSSRARLFIGCAALLICAAPREAAAQAKTWHRIATVTTQTANQLCYTNGTDIICDSNAPTLSGTSVGIGSTLPIVSLDISQMTDALALPGGSNAQRPTGAALVNGEIRYNNTGTGQVEAYYNGAWNSLVTSATLGTSTPAAGSTGYVQFNSGGYLGASSNLFWNNSSGYLGIGTTSPQQALSVTGSANVTGYVGIGIGTATAITPLLVGQSPAGVAPSLSAENGVATFRTSTTPELQIGGYPTSPFAMWMQVKRTSNDGTSWPLAIQPLGGNVGIGTTAPGNTLEISTTGTGGGLRLQANSTDPYYYTDMSTHYASPAVFTLAMQTGGTNSTMMTITKGVSTVFNTGNVGIGSTSPSQLLDVSGTAIANAVTIDNRTGSANAILTLTGRNAGAASSAQILANLNGGVEIVPSNGLMGINLNPSTGATLQVSTSAAIGYAANTALSGGTGLAVSGNVGIGTTSPNVALDTRGIIADATTDYVTASAGSELLIFHGAATGNTYSALQAYSNGGLAYNNITLNALGGNVGIGTTSPVSALTVASSSSTYIRAIGSLGSYTGVDFGQTSSGQGIIDVRDAQPLGLFTNALERMRIDASGNVGIGTTGPTSALHVVSSSAFPTSVATIEGSNNNSSFSLKGTSSGAREWKFIFGGTGSSVPGGLRFFDATGSVDRMVIDSSGNVGIGTTSPAGTLDVEGGTASSGNGTSVKVYAQNGQASGNTNGGNIVLMPGTANGTGKAGAVGIGTATPASDVKADINGAVKVAGSGSETCATTADIGKFRYNQALGYFELCSP
jgi:hypothetical protein